MPVLYPYIELSIDNQNDKLQYVNTSSFFKVYLYNSATEIKDVTNQVYLDGMDPHNSAKGEDIDSIITTSGEDVTNNVNTVLGFNKDALLFKKEGLGKIKIFYDYYNDKNEKFTLVTEKEIIVYDTFFKDNYLKHLLPNFESQKIQQNKKLKIMLDTMMEYMDIAYAYKNDIQNINDPLLVKDKLLSSLGQNFGLNRYDSASMDTKLEYVSSSLYRELIKNLLEIVGISGTKLSYELFFGALGYNIDLDEFWFNENGQLIEIDPEDTGRLQNGDTNKSKFFKYATNGLDLDIPPKENLDPRKNLVIGSEYNKNQKSKYVRPLISQKPNFYNDYTLDNKKIIRQYLDFLKPQHIEYLTEILSMDISNELLPLLAETLANPLSLIELGDDVHVEPPNPLIGPLPEFYDILAKINNDSSMNFILTDLFFAAPARTYDETLGYYLRWDTGWFWDTGYNNNPMRFDLKQKPISEYSSLWELQSPLAINNISTEYFYNNGTQIY